MRLALRPLNSNFLFELMLYCGFQIFGTRWSLRRVGERKQHLTLGVASDMGEVVAPSVTWQRANIQNTAKWILCNTGPLLHRMKEELTKQYKLPLKTLCVLEDCSKQCISWIISLCMYKLQQSYGNIASTAALSWATVASLTSKALMSLGFFLPLCQMNICLCHGGTRWVSRFFLKFKKEPCTVLFLAPLCCSVNSQRETRHNVIVLV